MINNKAFKGHDLNIILGFWHFYNLALSLPKGQVCNLILPSHEDSKAINNINNYYEGKLL